MTYIRRQTSSIKASISVNMFKVTKHAKTVSEQSRYITLSLHNNKYSVTFNYVESFYETCSIVNLFRYIITVRVDLALSQLNSVDNRKRKREIEGDGGGGEGRKFVAVYYYRRETKELRDKGEKLQ